MINGDLTQLIEKRQDWVRVSKANNFDFDSILAGLYNDPSHFIYEILQNAEDAYAKEVKFELFEDRLDVYHDGIDFDFKDIDGVTGIGIYKKKDDLNSIGKFGVGFKSVFAITKTPYIFSGDYSIKIEDFVIPSVVSDYGGANGTLIRLPFNHNLRLKDEVFALVSKKLENIGLKTLLFLKNIEEIRWKTPSASGHYLKSSDNYQKEDSAKKVTIISANDIEEYIVLERPIRIENRELTVEVAYKLGKDKNGKEIIVQEPDSKLVVFFPTEKVTFLHFLIQGPYKTTPNRENIPLEDEQNKLIIDETAKLIAESLPIIKNLGYLDTNFLNILPIDPQYRGNEVIYSVIYSKVKEKLLSDEELLPTFGGRYTKTSDALLARGRELPEFLGNDDIKQLFDRYYWLDINITYDKTRELRDFLINDLEIIEVDFEDFAKRITADFLQGKSDEWMIDFYCRLLDQQALWCDRVHGPKAILRTKPIIRLDSNEHIRPFDDKNKVHTYLPSETRSQYKTVKRILADNEDALKFLKELGLTKPDLFAEIREFILPKYQRDDAIKDESYLEDFEKLLTAYETIASSKKKDFIEQLSKVTFIDSIKHNTKESSLCNPSKTYLKETDLIEYFSNNHTVYFVSDALYETFGEERLKPFLIDLGTEDKPRRIEIDANLSWEEKNKLRGNSGWTRDVCHKDYEYEGVENLLEHITIEKSYLIWKLLLKSIEKLNSWEARQFFEGEYSWFYYSQHTRRFDAQFLGMLREKQWLVNKDGIFQKSSDLMLSELSNSYIKESPNLDVLLKILGFKPDVIDRLPEEYRNKLELVKDYSLEDLERLILEDKKKNIVKIERETEGWLPDHKPDEVNIKVVEMTLDKIVTADLKDQANQLNIAAEGDTQQKDVSPKNKNDSETSDHVDKKRIGDWGEQHVYYALKTKFQGNNTISETDFGFKTTRSDHGQIEVVWLNKHKNIGKGYDFVIKMNGKEIECIEVKTKTKEAEELIEITGTQWEFARKLFEGNEGDKYSLYIVSNAGKSNAHIRILNDPIKLWKEGKLYAHPVNFKL